MARGKALAVLPEAMSLLLRTRVAQLTIAYNFTSRKSDALF